MSSFADIVENTIPSSKQLDEDIKRLRTEQTQLKKNLAILNKDIDEQKKKINQEIENEKNGKYPSSWYGNFLLPDSPLYILDQELSNLYYDEIDIKHELNIIHDDLKDKINQKKIINQTSLNR